MCPNKCAHIKLPLELLKKKTWTKRLKTPSSPVCLKYCNVLSPLNSQRTSLQPSTPPVTPFFSLAWNPASTSPVPPSPGWDHISQTDHNSPAFITAPLPLLLCHKASPKAWCTVLNSSSSTCSPSVTSSTAMVFTFTVTPMTSNFTSLPNPSSVQPSPPWHTASLN